MTNFKIEKNIPLQEDKLLGAPRKYPLDKILVGESWDAGEYDRKLMQAIYNSIRFYLLKSGNEGKKFECRKTPENKIRVWRIQ